MNKKIKILLSGAALILWTALARAYELQISLPGFSKSVSGPAEYIRDLYRFSLIAVGILAIGIIVYYAIQYTVSAGNTSKQQDAREGITQALLGLVLLLGAFLVLYTINPNLVTLKDPGVPQTIDKRTPKQTKSEKLFDDITGGNSNKITSPKEIQTVRAEIEKETDAIIFDINAAQERIDALGKKTSRTPQEEQEIQNLKADQSLKQSELLLLFEKDRQLEERLNQ